MPGFIIAKLTNFYQRWRPILPRLWSEARLPLACACAWGGFAWIQGSTAFQSLSAAGVAFVGVLFAQGQIFRVEKNARDEQNARSWTFSLQAIEQILKQTQNQKIASPGDPATFDDTDFNSGKTNLLIQQAKQIWLSGLHLPAALVAANAFEHSFRELAATLGAESKESLSELLHELRVHKNIEESTKEYLQLFIYHRNFLSRVPDDAQGLELVSNQLDVTQLDEKNTEGLILLFQIGVGYCEKLTKGWGNIRTRLTNLSWIDRLRLRFFPASFFRSSGN